MEKVYHLNRDHSNGIDTTLGTITREWVMSHFGYSLEDIQRKVKIPKQTAIPCGLYNLEIRTSPKYGKVVVIFTRKETIEGYDWYYLEMAGMAFTMVLGHGGNTHLDTDGCVLVNAKRDVKTFKANGSLKDKWALEVEELINKGDTVFLRVTSSV